LLFSWVFQSFNSIKTVINKLHHFDFFSIIKNFRTNNLHITSNISSLFYKKNAVTNKIKKASAKFFHMSQNSAQLRISLMANEVRHYLKLRSEPRGIFAHFCCWQTKVGQGSGRSARYKKIWHTKGNTNSVKSQPDN
jgi:hypothetical protein